MDEDDRISRADADALAGRLCAAAVFAARSEAAFFDVLDEFDASGAVRWQTDVKSVAHWLSYSCSMTPGVAREHVRVARGLRQMPAVRAAFAAGELSYSKVREVTRVAGVVDDTQFLALARTATASQLARMVSAYRSASGARVQRPRRRSVTWWTREDGMVELRGCLEPEEGALLIAAISAAKDQFGTPATPDTLEVDRAPEQVDTTPVYSNADALVDVARGFLDAVPHDRSGEDRTMVVVHVSAELLAGPEPENVPAGTRDASPVADSTKDLYGDVPTGTSGEAPEAGSTRDLSGNVPAGTFPGLDAGTCFIEGVGPIEPQTARRLACDSRLLGAILDAHGEVLALGRSRRYVSTAQRRALMIRDRGLCQFPGCAQTRHLDAHHAIAWAAGGGTDLDNLVLLCGFHHTCVHEGGMTLRRQPGGWVFSMPDGRPHEPWYDADSLPDLLRSDHDPVLLVRRAELGMIDSAMHPTARKIRPLWTGERFDLGECVRVLFQFTLPEGDDQDDQVLAA